MYLSKFEVGKRHLRSSQTPKCVSLVAIPRQSKIIFLQFDKFSKDLAHSRIFLSAVLKSYHIFLWCLIWTKRDWLFIDSWPASTKENNLVNKNFHEVWI